MAVKIKFETGNAAFAQHGYKEVRRILREIADSVSCSRRVYSQGGVIRDVNGIIGEWEAAIDWDATVDVEEKSA